MIPQPLSGHQPSATGRRSAVRSVLARQALTTTAIVSIGATALVFVALSARTSTRPTSVALPSGQAAAAAFTRGLAAARTAPAAAAQPATSTSGATAVAIKNYAFAPAVLTVTAGTKVTWTNDDVAPHTVTVASGPVTFSSPTLNKGDSFTYTFTAAGTYSYYCAVHPDMTAKVVVTAAPVPAPKPTPSGTTPAPAPSPSTSSPSMPMPGPAPAGSDCALSSALQTFLTHVNSAHLDESPAQQVNDILNIDTYAGNHLALFERMLSPATSGGLTDATSGALQTLLTHLNSAHLDESPAQQVSDILDVNSYLGNHMALIQRMAAGYESLVC